MRYEMLPAIDISDLEEELLFQYQINWQGELSQLLFDDTYINDVYKAYRFDEMLDGEDEEIDVENCVRSILQDIFPDYRKCLINVSW